MNNIQQTIKDIFHREFEGRRVLLPYGDYAEVIGYVSGNLNGNFELIVSVNNEYTDNIIFKIWSGMLLGVEHKEGD